MSKIKPLQRKIPPKRNDKKMREQQEQDFFSSLRKNTTPASASCPELAQHWQALTTTQKITLAIVFLLGLGATVTTIYYLAPHLVAQWNRAFINTNQVRNLARHSGKMTGKPVKQNLVKQSSMATIAATDYLPRTILRQFPQTLDRSFQDNAVTIAEKLKITTGSILAKIQILPDDSLEESLRKTTAVAARVYMACAILHAMDRSELHANYIRLALESPQFQLLIIPASKIKGDKYVGKYVCSDNTIILVDPLQQNKQHLINFIIPHEFTHVIMASINTGSPKSACTGNDPRLFQRVVAPFETKAEQTKLASAIDQADEAILNQFAKPNNAPLLEKQENTSSQAIPDPLKAYQPMRYYWLEPRPKDLTVKEYIAKIESGKEIITLGKNQQIFYPDSFKEIPEGIEFSGFLVPDPEQNKAEALKADTIYRTSNLKDQYKRQALRNSELTYVTESHAWLMPQPPDFLQHFYPKLLEYTKQQIAKALKMQTDFYQAERFRTPAYPP